MQRRSTSSLLVCGGGGSNMELPHDVYNDLLCPICLELFRHPVILPCSHVLCRVPCAEHLFDYNFIRCPVCRENCYVSGGVTSLPRVIALESIIDKYRTQRRLAVHQHSANTSAANSSNHSHTNHSHRVHGCHNASDAVLTVNGGSNLVCANHSFVESTSRTLSPSSSPSSATSSSLSNGVLASSPTHQCSNSSNLIPRHGRRHLPVVPSARLNVDDSDGMIERHGLNHTSLSCIDQQLGSNQINGSFQATPRSSLRAFSQALQTQSRTQPSISSTPRLIMDSPDSTTIFDVSTDSVTSCPRHGTDTSVYCHVCARCLCDVCGDVSHVTSHETTTPDEAAVQLKDIISSNLEKMTFGQAKVTASLQQERQLLKDLEQALNRKREEINMQCDSLLAEVEHKRGLFLADLDQEERMRVGDVEQTISVMEDVLATSHSLVHHAGETTEKDTITILQVVPSLNERLVGSILDCEACQGQPYGLELDLLNKVIDLRKEQTLLREIHYLSPPGTPSVDVTRCARSDTVVALFIVPPRGSDVIDNYVIRFCSEEQKQLGIEETMTLQNGHSDHVTSSGAGQASYVAVLENLMTSLAYLFCVTAVNRAGPSGNSEVVQCVTLSHRDSVVPVPVLVGSMCQAYSSSIRVFTPSPHDVAPEQSISHFLLYRPRDRKCLWRSVGLCGHVEHRVFGLDPQTHYEFIVMATNPRGECQMSDKVVIETEGAS